MELGCRDLLPRVNTDVGWSGVQFIPVRFFHNQLGPAFLYGAALCMDTFPLLELRGLEHVMKNCPGQEIHKVLIRGVHILFPYVPKPATASVTGDGL